MHRPLRFLQIVVTSQRQSGILVQELLRCTPLGHSFEGPFDVGEIQVDIARLHLHITRTNQLLRLLVD